MIRSSRQKRGRGRGERRTERTIGSLLSQLLGRQVCDAPVARPSRLLLPLRGGTALVRVTVGAIRGGGGRCIPLAEAGAADHCSRRVRTWAWQGRILSPGSHGGFSPSCPCPPPFCLFLIGVFAQAGRADVEVGGWLKKNNTPPSVGRGFVEYILLLGSCPPNCC